MAENLLLLWGKNNDGQLGNRQHSHGSPPRRHSRGRENPTSPNKGSSTTRGPPLDSSPPRNWGLSSSASTDAFSSSHAPCPVLTGSRVLQVSCGSRHTLAVVAGGEAYSWGWGACGQLGHGDDHFTGVPRVIEALKAVNNGNIVGGVKCVSAGGIHSAAVDEKGHVYTWGGSSYGQLGLGPVVTAKGMQALPDRVMVSLESPRSSGEVGNMGMPRRTSMRQSADVLSINETQLDRGGKIPLLARVVACGGMHTAALTEEGVVYCWGRADSGQLGIGAEWIHETSSGVMGMEWPRMVRGHLETRRTASIACGGFHTAAVTVEGECYTWGKEDYGMLGCSNEALLKGGLFCPHPVTLCYPRQEGSTSEGSADCGQKVTAVACGGWHTAVIGEKGGVWTCGRGEYGRLGLGDQKSQWLLTPIDLEEREASTSTANDPASEDNPGGGIVVQAGDGGGPGIVLSPVPSPALPEPVSSGAVRSQDPATAVALGGSHSLAMTSSGRVFGFGRQEDGRLGAEVEVDDDDHGAALPVEVASLQLDGWTVRSLSCGGVHSAAILTRQSE